jgi:hypothetical protein
MKAVAEIYLETMHAAIAEWPEHPKACIEAERGILGDIIIKKS